MSDEGLGLSERLKTIFSCSAMPTWIVKLHITSLDRKNPCLLVSLSAYLPICLYNPSMPKELFLRSMPGILTARYSDQPSLGRRAGQLQRFLGDLQKTLEKNLQLSKDAHLLELWVLSNKDWSRLTSRPYGLAFLRQEAIIVPADYNPRAIDRFDDLLLAAAQEQLKAPGEVRELFDLLIAYEWAKGSLKSLGLQSQQSTQNRYLAAYLFLLVLQSEESLLERVLAWSKILALTQLKGTLKELFLIGQAVIQISEPSWSGLKELPKRL